MKLIAAIALAGCAGPAQTSTGGPDGHSEIGFRQGQESQGTFLLGEFIDAFGPDPVFHLSTFAAGTDAAGAPITVELSGGAALRSGPHVGADPLFDGVVLPIVGGGELKLSVSRGGSDLAFYHLASRPNPSEPWRDPCVGSAHNDAVPLAGVWRRNGLHDADPSKLSFACDGAVAFKCASWGFLAGADSAALAWRAHQACTRMARADYCANGHSHTREGTLIKLYDVAGVIGPPQPADLLGVTDWAPPPNEFYFEAAWNDGSKPASCLSRLRWQSLPLLGAACPDDTVKDPRLGGAAFCEDMAFPPADGSGPLVFNASSYDDLELHIWQRDTDMVSTVDGFYEPAGAVPVHQPFNPPNDNFTHVERDGMLLRKLPQGADPSQFEVVHVFARTGDVVIATDSQLPLLPGFTNRGKEGYVVRTQINRLVPFVLYHNATTDDMLSTALPPPDGYTAIATIGYIVPPPAN